MKIIQLVLHTNRLDELYHFYSNILQMLVIREAENEFDIVTNGTRLRFMHTDKISNPAYHFAFNIPSNKIEAAAAWLQQKIKLLWIDEYHSNIADFVNWHAKSVYFLDPAGNVVELIARFDLNDLVLEKFTSSHIRNVSEIGVVFPADHFDESVQNFMLEYQLAYFDKQPPLPQFRAIGNDDGLFIVVPEHRPWYPTKDQRSGVFPMQVSVETGSGKYTIRL